MEELSFITCINNRAGQTMVISDWLSGTMLESCIEWRTVINVHIVTKYVTVFI